MPRIVGIDFPSFFQQSSARHHRVHVLSSERSVGQSELILAVVRRGQLAGSRVNVDARMLVFAVSWQFP